MIFFKQKTEKNNIALSFFKTNTKLIPLQNWKILSLSSVVYQLESTNNQILVLETLGLLHIKQKEESVDTYNKAIPSNKYLTQKWTWQQQKWPAKN